MAQFASHDTGQQPLLFGYNLNPDWGATGSPADIRDLRTVLDPTQSAQMSTFFLNPDGAMDTAAETRLDWDQGPDAGPQDFESGVAGFSDTLHPVSHPAASLASPSNGTYQSHSSQQTLQSHSRPITGVGSRANEPATAEESAASGLLNMVHGHHQDSRANLSDLTSDATSWGNLSLHHFVMPSNSMAPAVNQGGHYYSGRRGFGTDNMANHQQGWFNNSMQMPAHPNYGLMPGNGDPTHHTFQPQHMQSPSSPQTPHHNHHTRPTLMAYGSDPHFSAGGYQAPHNWTSIEAEKGSNLNNVPLAAHAAATPSHMRFPQGNHEHMNKPHSFSTNSSSPQYAHMPHPNNMNLGGLPTTSNQYSARHYGSMAIPTVENGIGGGQFRPTKSNIRRPSQAAEDNDDDDYSPYGNGKQSGGKRKVKREEDSDEGNLIITPVQPTPKRRKSNNNTAIASSDEESDDGMGSDGSGSRKKRNRNRKSITNRENLTTEEKRQNHIKSEKQRRDLIKLQYDLLDIMVPGLKQGKSGLSRADIMNEICDYTVATNRANVIMAKKLADMHFGGGEEGLNASVDDNDDDDDDDDGGGLNDKDASGV